MMKRIFAAVVALCATTVSAFADTPYDPIPPTIPNLVGWYDASYTPSLTLSGSDVTAWADRSGTGNNLNVVTSPAPFYTASCLNSLGCVNFGGTSILSRASTNFNVANAPSTIILIGSGRPLTSTQTLAAGYGTFTTLQWRGAGVQNASGNTYPYIGLFGADMVTPQAITDDVPFIASYVFGSSSQSVSANGYTRSTQTFTPSTVGTGFQVGSATSFNPWRGKIEEVLVYNAAITQAQEDYLVGYLACKWGIQASLNSSFTYATSCPWYASPLFL